MEAGARDEAGEDGAPRLSKGGGGSPWKGRERRPYSSHNDLAAWLASRAASHPGQGTG